MKRILIAGAFVLAAAAQAFAADLPMPGPPPYLPVIPLYNWTGFYLGINGGGAFGNSNWLDPVVGNSGDFTVDGFLIGGTIGVNYQIGQWVLGVEGDGGWTNLDGSTGAFCAPACETKSNWLATVRGRAGWAWDRVLFYGTAGGAFANVQAGFSGGPFLSSTQTGWTAGLGVEYAFLPNWTAKLEYLFVDFADASCNFAACGSTTTTVSLNENIVRGGVNFKFGW